MYVGLTIFLGAMGMYQTYQFYTILIILNTINYFKNKKDYALITE